MPGSFSRVCVSPRSSNRDEGNAGEDGGIETADVVRGDSIDLAASAQMRRTLLVLNAPRLRIPCWTLKRIARGAIHFDLVGGAALRFAFRHRAAGRPPPHLSV